MTYYKVLTHDLRPPIQGGDPLWTGDLPVDLPMTPLNISVAGCAEGWNFSDNLADALTIAGLWRDGWPSRAFIVEPGSDAIQREGKWRSSTLRVIAECNDEEIETAILSLLTVFGVHQNEMARASVDWRHALSRPNRDSAVVEGALHAALEARGLDWTTKRFTTGSDVIDSAKIWDMTAASAYAAWNAWAARDARDAQKWPTAPEDWYTWGGPTTHDAWYTWDVYGDGRAAWHACSWRYASLINHVPGPPDKYDVGIQSAYEYGLAIALPTGPDELGWAMVVDEELNDSDSDTIEQ